MISRLNVEYEFDDNDASSSFFGWDFQINAGIYLFLNYIDKAQLLAVESMHQDIEMVLDDKTVYAQAKALQDEQTVGTEATKLRDAIVSLAKINSHDTDLMIYISNLRAPIDGDKDKFRNDIVDFSQCDPAQQTYINQQVEKAIEKLRKEIADKKCSETSKKKKEILLERLNNFNYSRLLISSIYPFSQTGDRYKLIKEKLAEVLVNKMELKPIYASCLVDRIILHWQRVLNFNTSIKDKANKRKYINKKDLVWTVIAIVSDEVETSFIENTLSSAIDSRMQEDCRQYLKNTDNLYHERFDFIHRVLQDYESFKKTIRGKRADEAFIESDEWKKYSSEFEDVHDMLLREYITKCYLFKIINRNVELYNISKGVKLCLSKS